MASTVIVFVSDLGHFQHRDLSVRSLALQRHAFLGRQLLGQGASRHFLDQLIVPRSVSVFCFDTHSLAVADRHALDGALEAGDHLAAAQHEFEGLAARGRIEFGAVIELSGVVSFDGVAVFCVANGYIVQAEKDNPFFNQIVGSGGIQVNVIFNKFW